METLGLPRLNANLSEAVAYGEIGFSGVLPNEGSPAAEIAALIMELRGAGWLPPLRQSVKSDIRQVVKA